MKRSQPHRQDAVILQTLWSLICAILVASRQPSVKNILRAETICAVVWFLVCACATSVAQADTCQIQLAPKQFLYQGGSTAHRTALPTSAGIVAPGFVALSDGEPVVHGIDVSKWQETVDFEGIKKCGGMFAYVRVSAGAQRDADKELSYDVLWANARSENFIVGPYHNLRLILPQRQYQMLSQSEKQKIVADNIKYATEQANFFIDRFVEELLGKDVSSICGGSSTILGCPYLPIALDASIRPQNTSGELNQFAIGELYGSAICAWFETVESAPYFRKQKFVFSTSAFIYKDYGLKRFSCLSDKIVWISQHNLDGGLPQSQANPETRAAISALCNDADGGIGRCLFHQYTSYGTFARFDPKVGQNLDRFYGSEDDLSSILQRSGTGNTTK
jgi:hypothetical protein